MYRLYLVIAGLCNVFIAIVHFAAIFIGPRAYAFLDAPQFSEMATNGSMVPAITTFFVALVFLFFAWYAFSSAGYGKRLPFQFFSLTLIGWLFTLRGLAVFVFIWANR